MENWKYKGKLAKVMQLAHLLNRPQGATIKQIVENIGYTSRTSAYYAIKALELDLDYPVTENEIDDLLSDPFCIWQGDEEIVCKIEMTKAIGVVESRREWGGKNI